MSTQKIFHNIFVLIAVLLSGCASVPITPLPVYANAIGAYAEADNDGGLDITDRKATKTMRVALVPTKNTRETARYMVGKQRECIAYDFPHDAVAFDAERLTQSISQILKNKFKSVVRADSIDSPAAQSADFVILNDIRVSVGGSSGQHTTVTLENFVARWEPGPHTVADWQRYLWAWIKRYNEHPERFPPIYLGYGTSDLFVRSHDLLAGALPEGRTLTVEGGHTYATLRRLWPAYLDKLEPELRRQAEPRVPPDN